MDVLRRLRRRAFICLSIWLPKARSRPPPRNKCIR